MELLRELDPAVIAVVASGYTDSDILARYKAHGFRGRLQKPFGLSSLSRVLAEALG